MVDWAHAAVVAATARLAIHTTFITRSLSRNGTDRIGSAHEKSNEINDMETTLRNSLWLAGAQSTTRCDSGGNKKGADGRPFPQTHGPARDQAEKYMSNSIGCVVMRNLVTSSILSVMYASIMSSVKTPPRVRNARSLSRLSSASSSEAQGCGTFAASSGSRS